MALNTLNRNKKPFEWKPIHNGSFIYIPKEVDNSDERTPQKNIEMYKSLIDLELKQKRPNKKHIENCKELIKREEKELKNPKVVLGKAKGLKRPYDERLSRLMVGEP